jgi:hypothetical protein
MKKILFRDEPFYVDIYKHPRWHSIGSFISIYSKHTGFIRYLKKYKLFAQLTDDSREEVSSRKTLIHLLNEAYCVKMNGEYVEECIECSPYVEAVYMNKSDN